MKNIIKIVMSLLVVFIGLASFASFGDYINPNLDVTEVKISTQPYLPETVVTDIIDCISKQVSIDG